MFSFHINFKLFYNNLKKVICTNYCNREIKQIWNLIKKMVEAKKKLLYMYLGTLYAGLRYLMITPTVAGNGWLHWRLTGWSLGPYLPSVSYKNFAQISQKYFFSKKYLALRIKKQFWSYKFDFSPIRWPFTFLFIVLIVSFVRNNLIGDKIQENSWFVVSELVVGSNDKTNLAHADFFETPHE